MKGAGDMINIIVGSVKAFVRLCNKKDYSHLPERRLVVDSQMGGLEVNDGIDDVEESEPVEIGHYERNRIQDINRVIVQRNSESDSDEEFSSTEDSPVPGSQKRRKCRRRRRLVSDEDTRRKEQLLFTLDM